MARQQLATLRRIRCVLAAALIMIGPHPVKAESLTQKSVWIVSRAIGFLQPAPSGTETVAIAYDPAAAASKADANAIAGYFGDGLKAGSANLRAQVVDVNQLASGHFIAVIPAADVNIDQVFTASRALHVLCITADTLAVQNGRCVMSVQSDPKVDIQINVDAASRSGVSFRSAFMFMARVK